jgi:hypothetical protein
MESVTMLTEKNIRRRALRLLSDAHNDALVLRIVGELVHVRSQPSTDLPYIPITGRNAVARNKRVEFGLKTNGMSSLKNDAAREQATADHFKVDLRTVQRDFKLSTKEQTIEGSSTPAAFTTLGRST